MGAVERTNSRVSDAAAQTAAHLSGSPGGEVEGTEVVARTKSNAMARKSNMSMSTCATLSSTEKKAPEQTAPEQTAPEETAPEQKADDVPSMSPKRLSDDA